MIDSHDDEEKLRTLANKIGAAAYERTPAGTDFGIYSYGDGPAAAGGGVGGFMWFETLDALLDYIAEFLVFLAPGPASEDHFEKARQVKTAVEVSRANGQSLDSLVPALNPLLRRYSQIVWIGRFDELMSGATEFCCGHRARFRDQWAEEDLGDASPIRPEELSLFHDYLLECGL